MHRAAACTEGGVRTIRRVSCGVAQYAEVCRREASLHVIGALLGAGQQRDLIVADALAAQRLGRAKGDELKGVEYAFTRIACV